jgi:hypothetical protein
MAGLKSGVMWREEYESAQSGFTVMEDPLMQNNALDELIANSFQMLQGF